MTQGMWFDGAMLHLPGVCDSCGSAFPTDVIQIGPGSQGITIENISPGACPRCNSYNTRIPNGIYSFKALAEEALVGANPDQMERLIRVLESLPPNTTGPAAADALEADDGRWKRIADFVRPKHASQVAGYLSFLYTLVRIFMG